MNKLRMMLNELHIYLNNSDEDEKVVLILCGPKEAGLLERAISYNKEITGETTLSSSINKEVYMFKTGEVDKFKSAFKNNKNSTFFIYNHHHLLCREEVEHIAEETNQTYNLIFYEDLGDDE
jgi:hypothetical protein